jgi:hypothetical protein
VRLHAKGSPRAKPVPRVQAPEPEPAAVPAPAATPVERAPEPARREVFLPSNASERAGGVFLPTKE